MRLSTDGSSWKAPEMNVEPPMMVVAALVVDRGWRGLCAARDADLAGDADGRATAGVAGETEAVTADS